MQGQGHPIGEYSPQIRAQLAPEKTTNEDVPARTSNARVKSMRKRPPDGEGERSGHGQTRLRLSVEEARKKGAAGINGGGAG
jgi:hypothetical protein